MSPRGWEQSTGSCQEAFPLPTSLPAAATSLTAAGAGPGAGAAGWLAQRLPALPSLHHACCRPAPRTCRGAIKSLPALTLADGGADAVGKGGVDDAGHQPLVVGRHNPLGVAVLCKHAGRGTGERVDSTVGSTALALPAMRPYALQPASTQGFTARQISARLLAGQLLDGGADDSTLNRLRTRASPPPHEAHQSAAGWRRG